MSEKIKYNKSFLWMICLVSAMGGLLFGYDWVVIGGAKPFYELYFDIDDKPNLQGWAMSCALVGCILGSIVSGVLADRLGRKRLLISSGVLFTVSAVGTGVVDAFGWFIVYRLLGGIGIGLASNLSPLYIAEVSPKSIRGRMVSVNQLAIVIGVLVAQVINWGIAKNMEPGLSDLAILESWYGQTGWRWMFISEVFPAFAFFALLFLIPESPRWLFQQGKVAESKAVLAKVAGEAYAEEEIRLIEESIKSEGQGVRIRDLFNGPVKRVVLIGVILAVYQQFCGINVIFYYAEEIFKAAGYELSGIMMTIVMTGFVMLLFTFVAMGTVDNFGRRTLMILGSGGLFLSHASIAIAYSMGNTGVHVLVCILIALACYAMSLAPITWVLLAELFPNRIRGAAMSVCVFSLWLSCAALAQGFPIMNEALGTAGCFWVFAGVCFAGLIFCWLKVPETKGKSLEEIESLLYIKTGDIPSSEFLTDEQSSVESVNTTGLPIR